MTDPDVVDVQASEREASTHSNIYVSWVAPDRRVLILDLLSGFIIIKVLMRHTDMGGENALHPVSVGVEGVLKTVLALKLEDSGSFYNFQGEIVPW